MTLNDTKRQAWFADLANPDVPLNKLGKSVPHGAKGHDLLDLLHSNNIAIPRAVWFLRVFGANETVSCALPTVTRRLTTHDRRVFETDHHTILHNTAWNGQAL